MNPGDPDGKLDAIVGGWSGWFFDAGADAMTPVAAAIWCVVVAVVILAMLMLEEHISRIENRRGPQ